MYIVDTTLREGMQRYGLYADLPGRKHLLQGVSLLGVEEIEIGPVRGDHSFQPLYEWARQTLDARLSIWTRCLSGDIRDAARLSPESISICIPVSDPHLKGRLSTDRPGIRKQVSSCLGLARKLGIPFVSLGLEDASRADPEFVYEMTGLAASCGADRVRVSDTVGVWNPVAVVDVVTRLRAIPGIALGVHCHNDFGMATANSIAALCSGADCADATLLGLGERAGLAPLEEVLGYLYFHAGQRHYHVAGLARLCRRTSEMLGLSHAPCKPVTGEAIFYTETGLHVDGQYKAPRLYDPFPPAAMGHDSRMDVGAKSGRGALKGKLRELGLEGSIEQEEHLLQKVRALSTLKKAPLESEEILCLAGWPAARCRKDSSPSSPGPATLMPQSDLGDGHRAGDLDLGV